MTKAKKIIAVYEIKNLVSGTFYVGSSTNLYERWRTHRTKLRAGNHPNKHLQSSWTKHGEEKFRFKILETFDSITDMEAAEEKLLGTYINDKKCCNLSRWARTPWRDAGENHPRYGKKLTDEQKQMISEATKQQWQTADPRTGQKHSEEARAKISAKVQQALAEGRGGKFIPSEETRKKMSEALKGNQCAKGYKRTDAEKEMIRQRMTGNQLWLGKKHSEESKAKMSKRVRETTSGQEFVSLTEALEHYGLKMPTLTRALKTGKPISKGPKQGLAFVYC